MKKDVYQIITDRILEQLSAGVVPWHRPWAGGEAGMPKNMVSGKPYRGINVFMLGLSGYPCNQWLTYKQAQAKGGQVRKGAKGFPVVFWQWIMKDKDGKESKRPFPIVRYYTVFNADQCDGIEYDKPEINSVLRPIEHCQQIVDAMPKRPAIKHEGLAAVYRPSVDAVSMPEIGLFETAEAYHSTLFHELTHSTGHGSRLDRHKEQKNHRFGSCDYSKEELIAEMGAAFLCGITGIENRTIDNSAAYIGSWVKQFTDQPKMVVESAQKAQKAVDFIIGATSTDEIAE